MIVQNIGHNLHHRSGDLEMVNVLGVWRLVLHHRSGDLESLIVDTSLLPALHHRSGDLENSMLVWAA